MVIEIDNLTGIHRRTAQKIKRGKVKIEATIDLHGERLEEAKQIVTNFIDDCLKQGLRLVLIITGKGEGILRDALPDVLDNWSSQIIAVATAHPNHGGGGAFYVLLRRNRDTEF